MPSNYLFTMHFVDGQVQAPAVVAFEFPPTLNGIIGAVQETCPSWGGIEFEVILRDELGKLMPPDLDAMLETARAAKGWASVERLSKDKRVLFSFQKVEVN